ncbi:MAG: alpha/beta fold hydrolase [Pyrinomonadaceae bacterium]|nr:alpha/beta fold hydrolase [Pyrinomonadaceae bacterium]
MGPAKALFILLIFGAANFYASPNANIPEISYQVKSEAVSFQNGSVSLKGTLYLPDNSLKNPALVVYHAASGGTRNFQFYEHFKKEIPSKGFAVLLFDRRGSGESNGDFDSADFTDLASDGIAGVKLLKSRKEIDPRRIGVWGVSQGGWIAPLAATMSGDISFVIIVSGPGVSPAEQMSFAARYSIQEAGYSKEQIEEGVNLRRLLDSYYRGQESEENVRKAVDGARKKPWFDLAYLPNRGNIPGNPKTTKWFQEMDFDPLPTLSKVKVPILVFFGETDRWVPIEESIKRIKKATLMNKCVEFHRIKGGDHLMMTGAPDSGGPVSKQYLKLLVEWLKSKNKPFPKSQR